MEELFETGKIIIRKLKKAGFEAYFVGGAVRDYVMLRSIHDVDITTNAQPEDVEQLFSQTIDVGKEHGTIVVLIHRRPFEVTTYRTETSYTDHRRPDEITFTTQLEEDLKRRDFTMNAMAMSEDYTVHDPYNGKWSIKERTIQTVGEANERFSEDALRMLRAIRFMSTLKFTLSPDTSLAITKYQETLFDVAIERIVVELRKMYHGENIEAAKAALENTGLIKHIPFFKEMKQPLTATVATDMVDEIFLQIHFDHSLMKFLNELNLPNNDKRIIKNMLSLMIDLNQSTDPVKIAFDYENTILKKLASISNYNNIMNEEVSLLLQKSIQEQPDLPIHSRQDLNVDGKMLMEVFNLKGGPWIKELLSILEEAVLFKKLQNNQDELIEWVRSYVIIKDGNIKIIE